MYERLQFSDCSFTSNLWVLELICITFFCFVCGLSASAGNLLILFSPLGKNQPMRVICRAGKRPEITVPAASHNITCMLCPYAALYMYVQRISLYKWVTWKHWCPFCGPPLWTRSTDYPTDWSMDYPFRTHLQTTPKWNKNNKERFHLWVV